MFSYLNTSILFSAQRMVSAFFVMFLTIPAAHAFEPDWSLYEEILSEHTYDGHREYMDAKMVNYGALKADPRWGHLLGYMAAYPKSELKTKEQKLAFYLNGYNILSIDMVVRHWPIRRLKSLGSMVKPVWTHRAGILAGEEVTLRHLEHGILRKLGDPRVHLAINCASMSCPDLRHEPYSADRIESQLSDQSAKFLLQENKGILIDNNRVYLSSIFIWFEEDFDVMGGVEAFVKRFRPDLPADIHLEGALPYNWNVNAEMTNKERRQALAASVW